MIKLSAEELVIERYKPAYDLAVAGMAILSAAGFFIYANAAFCRLFGYTDVELHERTADSLLFAPREDGLHSAGADGTGLFKRRYQSKNNGAFVATVCFTPLPGTVFKLLQITEAPEQSGSGTVLDEADSLYRLITEHCSDVISKHDLNGIYSYVSPSCQAVLGYEPEELIGQRVFDLFHPEDLSIIKQINLRDSAVLNLSSYRIRKKNGEYLWFETNARAVTSADGALREVVCVSRDISTRKDAEQRLQQTNEMLQIISSIDALTGIANRRSFDETIMREWRHAMRLSSPLTVILLDIDYFKRYNDRYGHNEGDYCLKQVAQAIRRSVKQPGDMVARYGGEEFVIVLPNTDDRGASHLGERLRAEVEALQIPHAGSKISPVVTVSLGTATMTPSRACSPKELLIRADRALYQAKQQGRNRALAYVPA